MARNRAAAALMSAGFVTALVQILFTRELLADFAGSELVIAAILSGWLFWAGLGSRFAGRFWNGGRKPTGALEAALTAYFFLVPLSYMAVREAWTLLGLVPGEGVPAGTAILFSFIATAPLAFPAGSILVIGARLFRAEGPGGASGLAYAFDSAGAFLAGTLFTFGLAGRVSAGGAILLFMAVCVTGVFLAPSRRSRRKTAAGLALIALTAAAAFNLKSAENLSLQLKWDNALSETATRYGTFTVTRGKAGGYAYFYNGQFLRAAADDMSAEEAAVMPLLFLHRPANAFIVGGITGGAGYWAERFSNVRAVNAEIDSAIPDLIEEAPPKGRIVLGVDAIRYLSERKKKYDAIIITAGDPLSAQLNRYYTAEFFRLAKSRLTKNGVFSFGVTSGEEYLGAGKLALNASMFKTFTGVFDNFAVFPGERLCLVGFNGQAKGDYPSVNAAIRAFGDRSFPYGFLTPAALRYRSDPARVRYFLERMKKAGGRENRALTPVTYYYYALLWSRQGVGLFGRALKLLSLVPLAEFAGGFGLLLVLAAAAAARKKAGSRILAVAATGFWTLSAEFILLLFFQAKSGSLYTGYGILTALFMAGIALGAGFGALKKPAGHGLVAAGLTETGFLGFIAVGIYFLNSSSRPDSAVALFCGLAMFTAGSLGGFKIPLAAGKNEKTGLPAVIFWADLSGGCLGALFSGLIAVPLYGVYAALFLAALAPAAALVSLTVNS